MFDTPSRGTYAYAVTWKHRSRSQPVQPPSHRPLIFPESPGRQVTVQARLHSHSPPGLFTAPGCRRSLPGSSIFSATPGCLQGNQEKTLSGRQTAHLWTIGMCAEEGKGIQASYPLSLGWSSFASERKLGCCKDVPTLKAPSCCVQWAFGRRPAWRRHHYSGARM